MTIIECLLAALVAMLCGLDRVAVGQMMISRPIVAAPLTGFVLGEPLIGLQVGMLVELLWLGRLPVGASIPPDDTQASVGGTFLAVYVSRSLLCPEPVAIAFSLILTLPLGKFGQLFDHMVRRANNVLGRRAERFLLAGELNSVERSHLVGIGHFAVASLSTFTVIAVIGLLLSDALAPIFAPYLEPTGSWLYLALPLIGASMLVANINISRSLTLFSASFASALLILWLL